MGCCYLKAQHSFFSSGSVSLWQSVLIGLLLSESRTFPFFLLALSFGSQSYLDCFYLKAEPFLFFLLALSLLGSQSYLGYCYLKAELSLFFSWFCLLGSQSYLDCFYLKAEPFLFFLLALSLLGCQSYLGCCYLRVEPIPFLSAFVSLGEMVHSRLCVLSNDKLILSMNLDIMKFTCLDCTFFFLYRFNVILTMKNRDATFL